MKYKDFEGNIEELICRKLQEIQQEENVKILHAVESGSRAWGFASPDSDYDVRFIYVRPMDYYLSLEKKCDFIDWELDDTLDINGWDLSKALQQFHRSNATLFEWNQSPIIYQSTEEWSKIRQLSLQYFSAKSCIYHYYGTARKNYYGYLQEDMVKYKKYFYVLRPILACKWIEMKNCPPPVLFSELVDSVLEEEMKPLVQKLTQEKMQMNEGEKGSRIDVLNHYIEENLERYGEMAAAHRDDRNPDWEPLNKMFRERISILGK